MRLYNSTKENVKHTKKTKIKGTSSFCKFKSIKFLKFLKLRKSRFFRIFSKKIEKQKKLVNYTKNIFVRSTHKLRLFSPKKFYM